MADVLPAHSQASGPASTQSEMKSGEQVPPESNGIPRSVPNNGKEKKSNNLQDGKTLPNGTKGKEQAQDGMKDEKLSGAELKKRKQAEKAARRVQEKERKPQTTENGKPQGTSKPENKQESKSKGGKKAPPTPTVAQAPSIEHPQHRRKGSMQKTAHPRAQLLADAPLPEPPKQDRRVALFGHLYGKEARRSSIAGANKDVDPAILALGLQMSNYIICGSSARCVALLLVLKRVISSYTTPPGAALPRHLTTHLSTQIDYLVSCRPLSVSMGNAIRWLKLQISRVDPDTPESTAKEDLCESIDIFIRDRISIADKVIADLATQKIKPGDVILTFAKSNAVQQSLIHAHRKGINFSVIVVDSRPLFEGKNLARTLSSLGINVQYTLTHGAAHAMKEATKVFLGAHAMMSNGRLYSRVGTSMVAMLAQSADVPVIVCCETIKFTDKVALDSIVTNEVAPPEELVLPGDQHSALSSWGDTHKLQLLNLMYDVTPAEYVSVVITENGSLPPSSVPVVFRQVTET